MRRLLASAVLAGLSGWLPVGPAAAAEISDTADLEAFVDGVVETAMAEHNTAGVVVAITSADEVLLAKGYGYADVALETPVNPATTLFRIGSVTKLFTWTALMQLLEQGRVDLDTDVNEYLKDLEIPDTFPEPVTIADLMTHSGGFEDRIIGLFSLAPESMRPYAEVLGEDLPDRVRRPGWVSSYSNHGVGIAGLIVEDVSGLTWDEYVRRHILAPLGMTNTAAAQPVPGSLDGFRATGHSFVGGRHRQEPFQFVPLGAAGGMSATALDMTKFAMAHLNDGAVADGARILERDTAQRMHSPLFQPYPELNSWLHGFIDYSEGPLVMLGHSGGTFWFFTEFVLIPEEGVSIFVSTNTVGGALLNRAVLRGVLDRYFQTESAPPEVLKDGSDLSAFTGDYATFRHPVTTLAKLLRLAGTVSLTATEEGQLMALGLGRQPSYWQETAPGVFRDLDDKRYLRIVIDDEGTRLFAGSVAGSFYKLTGLHRPAAQLGLLIPALALFCWALIAWPLQRLSRFRGHAATLPRTVIRSRWVLWLAGISVFVTLIGIGLNASQEVVYGITLIVKGLLLVPFLTLALLLAQIVIILPLLRDTTVAAPTRVFHLVLTLGLVVIAGLLYYWNLIGTG